MKYFVAKGVDLCLVECLFASDILVPRGILRNQCSFSYYIAPFAEVFLSDEVVDSSQECSSWNIGERVLDPGGGVSDLADMLTPTCTLPDTYLASTFELRLTCGSDDW